MKAFQQLPLITIFLAFAMSSGCGGGSSGDSADVSPAPVAVAPVTYTGVIIDSPIDNIHYRASSGHEGNTDNCGEFIFEEGDSVTFSIGDLVFDPIPARAGLTPLELFDAHDIHDRRVVNFARLVQTLDDDGDISVCINITKEGVEAVSNAGFTPEDFDMSEEDFTNSVKVQTLLTELNLSVIAGPEEVKVHLELSIRKSDKVDRDDDGTSNDEDHDDDGDGISDEHDLFPDDPSSGGDLDQDGIDSLHDSDDDGDGVSDEEDLWPYDSSESTDFDGDGIGDNADPDDDNDTVPDVVDEYPHDDTRSGDFDSDGLENLVDDDDDNDNVTDDRDAFPYDASEHSDWDCDGIGDTVDIDNDNDSIPDHQDRLIIGCVESAYPQEAPIRVLAKGFDPTFANAQPEDGWHIQFYTYSVDDPGNYLTEYTSGGAYNAQYDPWDQTWIIEYWAPRVPGKYRTEITLYCSMSPSACDTNFPYEEYKQEVSFTSTCSTESCTYELDDARGNYVSNSKSSSVRPGFVQRSNGQLVAVYTEFRDGGLASAVSHSDDGGKTWKVPTDLPAPVHGEPNMIETSGGTLMFLAMCSGLDICLFDSGDGVTWGRRNLTQNTSFAPCPEADCSQQDITSGSLTQLSDSSYVITYYLRVGDDIDVYVTRSADLQNWSAPAKVSSGAGWDFDPHLLETQSGDFYLVFVSYTKQALVIAKSPDLVNWQESYTVNWSPHLHMKPRLLEISGKPALFFASSYEFYYSYLTATGAFSAPQMLLENIPFGPEVKKLQDGQLGIMYEMDLNNQRDIFFEELPEPAVDF